MISRWCDLQLRRVLTALSVTVFDLTEFSPETFPHTDNFVPMCSVG
jgi:hypothetical protein